MCSPPEANPKPARAADARAASVVTRLRAAGCVFAEDEARLLLAAARSPAELDRLLQRRLSGFPLEHILGWAEFCGIRIAVGPGVFVPRRRTEFLVRHAIAIAHAADQGTPVVLDLCCGSGAVGAAMAQALNPPAPGRPGAGIELFSSDIDPAAVRFARRNIEPVGQVFEGDLYSALPAELAGRVSILVANAPYVPTDAIGTMPPEARLHEASVALDGGEDGLDVQRRIAAEALRWLAPGGHLLVETSRRQAPATARIIARAGLAVRVVRSEELEATLVIGSAISPRGS